MDAFADTWFDMPDSNNHGNLGMQPPMLHAASPSDPMMIQDTALHACKGVPYDVRPCSVLCKRYTVARPRSAAAATAACIVSSNVSAAFAALCFVMCVSLQPLTMHRLE